MALDRSLPDTRSNWSPKGSGGEAALPFFQQCVLEYLDP